MSNKWDDKLREKFLNLYRKHKCLWNPYSPDYKNCSVKNEAFKIVVEELNVPKIKASECLRQIEVIREKYKEEQIKAEEELKSGKLYKSKLPWFDLMSEMLCEVINDEANFIENPVEYVQCFFAKGEQNKDLEESSSPLEKTQHNVEIKLKLNNPNHCAVSEETSEHVGADLKESNRHSEDVNDANGVWNICPYCGWEKEETRFGGAQNEQEVELPQRDKETRINNTNNSMKQINQLASSLRCVEEINCSNLTINAAETNATEVRKKVLINSEIEPSKLNDCNVTHDKSNSKAPNSPEVTSSKKNCVQHPRSGNELKKNVTMFPKHVEHNNPSQYLKNLLPNFETEHRNDESTPYLILYQDSFDRKTKGDKNMPVDRYDSCVEEFRESNDRFDARSEDDGYEVRSRFKVVIPNSDQEDDNLEITGYEVRTMNPQISKYILSPKVAIENNECLCKNELPVRNKNVDMETARYSNFIKLDIRHKRSKERRGKKRSGKCHQSQTLDSEDDSSSETEVSQSKSFSNKKIQTDRIYENQTIQTSKDEERIKSDYLKSAKDKGCCIETSTYNETARPEITRVSTQRYQDETVRSEMDKSLVTTEKFNNTKIVLNIIVKILESDTLDKSEDLQTTLETMLHTFQGMSVNAHEGTERSTINSHRNSVHNDTSRSTEYGYLPSAQRVYQNINPQEPRNKTVELDDTINLVTSSPTQGSKVFVELPDGDKTLELSGETSYMGIEEVGKTKRNSEVFGERNSSKKAPSQRLNDTNSSKALDNSVLDYSSDFTNTEPVASSSRKFEERRRPSQLAKDFLDVIKYTMMMDQALELTQNGNNDCCKK